MEGTIAHNVLDDGGVAVKNRADTYKDMFKRGHEFMQSSRYLNLGDDPEHKAKMLSFRQSELPKAQAKVHDDVDEMKRIETLAKGGSDALAIIEDMNQIKLPDTVYRDKWELQRVICGHSGWVRSIDVDISNTFFVTGSVDRLIKVWDLASGDLKVSLTGHIGSIRCLKLSHRHPYMFSCAEDNMVKCWDLEANRVIRHYHGHLNGVYSLDIHPTLDVLCSAGRDAVVRVWDMRTRKQIHILEGHTNTVEKVKCQNLEPQIISSSHDRTVRCWDIAAGKTRSVLTHSKKAVRSISVHPNEYKFLAGGGDGIRMYKGPDSEFGYEFQPVNSIIHTMAIREDADGAVVVAGCDNGLMFFYDLNSGKVIQTIETQPQPGSLSVENAIFDMTFDRSETRLLTAECDKTIKIYKEVHAE